MEKLTFILEMKDNISKSLKEVTNATKDIKKSTKGVDKGFDSIRKSAEQVAPTGSKITNSFKGLDGVKRSTAGVSQSFDRAKGSVDGFSANSGKLNSELKKQESMFGKLKGSVGAYAVAIGGALAGAAVAGFGKDVLQVGMDFDAGMSTVEALSGATAGEIGRLRQKAKQMGATTKFSAIESAEAFEYMALAGWDVNEMLEGADGILAAAAASGEEIATVADIVTDNLSAFGLQAKDSTMAADVFAKTSTLTNTSVVELGEGLKYTNAAAKASNMELYETNAMLGLLANNSIKGSSGGTVLNAMLRDLKKNAEGGKVAIGDTSVAVYDANGNFRDHTKILKDIEEATKGMTQEQRDAALSAIYGDEAMRGLNIVMGEGVDTLIDLEEQIKNSTGAAEDMAEIQLDNLKGDITNLSSAWEGLKIAIFDTGFGDVFRPFVQGLGGAIGKTSEFATKIGIMFSDVKDDEDLKILKETFQDTFSGEEIEELLAKGDEMKEKFGEIKQVFADIGDAFQETFGDTIAEIVEFARGVFEGFIEFFVQAYDTLQPTLQQLGELFGEVWSTIGEVFTTAWGIIEPILSFLWSLLQTLGNIALMVFMGIIVPSVQLVWAAFQNAWAVIQPILELFGVALEVAGEIATWLLNNAITPLATYIIGGFKAAIDTGKTVIEGFGKAFSAVGDFISDVIGKFKDFVSNVTSFEPPAWMSSIGGAIGGAATKVGNFISGSHATGAYNIPYDGYVAELHAGESILTADQSAMLRGMGVLQQSGGNTPTVDLSRVQQPTFDPSALERSMAPSSTTTTSNASFTYGDIVVNVSGGGDNDAKNIANEVRRVLNQEANKAAAVLGF